MDLSKFPKLGVRVPASLKRQIQRLVLDMDEAGISFRGNELTMEAIVAVATLELLGMDTAKQTTVFQQRIPELVALFERESF